MLKRAMDILGGGLGLLLLSPLLVLVGLAILVTMGRPCFFRQQRVGRYGRGFWLIKFRTMTMSAGAEKGQFDAGRSTRVTPLGRILRKTKVDELPELWNVFVGDMSLVGPRPEIPKWVAVYPERWGKVLAVRPGITDPASIKFRNEEEILAQAANPDQAYREQILPTKLGLYEEYVRTQSFWGDVGLIFKTLWVVVRG